MGNSDIMPKDISVDTFVYTFVAGLSVIISGLAHNANKDVWVGPVALFSTFIRCFLLFIKTSRTNK